MHTLLAIILLILVLLYVIFKLFIGMLIDSIRIILGWKKYEFTKILSYGMSTDHRWFKRDEEALKYGNRYEFIEIIMPYKKRIKPLN